MQRRGTQRVALEEEEHERNRRPSGDLPRRHRPARRHLGARRRRDPATDTAAARRRRGPARPGPRARGGPASRRHLARRPVQRSPALPDRTAAGPNPSAAAGSATHCARHHTTGRLWCGRSRRDRRRPKARAPSARASRTPSSPPLGRVAVRPAPAKRSSATAARRSAAPVASAATQHQDRTRRRPSPLQVRSGRGRR